MPDNHHEFRDDVRQSPSNRDEQRANTAQEAMIDCESEQGANDKVTIDREAYRGQTTLNRKRRALCHMGGNQGEPRHGTSEQRGEPGQETGEQAHFFIHI